ncbi:hypothetical protein A3K70_03255 [Candidatus Bathyarchaeota archaeon RBG_16_48_13]|nr:MAG: hypothetical protein A3K70_03255 [Candidatus Bathyarchaeota archaeon RBG_16_48_13]
MQGYPISPATEISEHMVLHPSEVGGVCVQMEDKTATMTAVIGVFYAGAKAMMAISGPGFDLMAENIGFAVMTEAPLGHSGYYAQRSEHWSAHKTKLARRHAAKWELSRRPRCNMH